MNTTGPTKKPTKDMSPKTTAPKRIQAETSLSKQEHESRKLRPNDIRQHNHQIGNF